MSVCGFRSYYPATNGVYKLRRADGDLVWEARSTAHHTMNLLKVGERIVAPGAQTAIARVFTEEDGTLSVATDLVAGNVMAPSANSVFFSDSFESTILIGSAANPGWAYRFDLSDDTYLGRVGLGGDAFNSLRLFDASHIDCIAAGRGPVRLDAETGTRVINSNIALAFSNDRSDLFVTDGSHYYVGGNSNITTFRAIKLDIASLAVVASYSYSGSSTRGSLTQGNVRDGMLAFASGGTTATARHLTLINASDMTLIWFRDDLFSAGYSIGHVDVCANFLAVIGGDSAFTVRQVKRVDIDGTIRWTVPLLRTAQTANVANRSIVQISEDKNWIYVAGNYQINGIPMGLIVLDALSGEIVWCFSSENGTSILETDDAIYLSVTETLAPSYR